jgi:aspartate-semialdehyde dehydrogenase
VKADLKIAVTGAAGTGGHALRTLLAARRVPAERLRLLEGPSEEAIISEYAGQPTLIGTTEPEALADRDIVFLCGSEEESARCLLWERKKHSVYVDLSGAATAQGKAPVVNMEVNASVLAPRPATIGAPHAISFTLTSALAPLESGFGIAAVEAVVLRPVSDFGEAGLEELHKQTVALLNFTEMPKELFGRQAGFNVLPQSSLERLADGAGIEARLCREIEGVFGWTQRRATVRTLVVPVFHGLSVLVHLRLNQPAPLKTLRKALADAAAQGARSAAGPAPTPAEAAAERVRLAADISSDGLGDTGFWLWLVASDTAAHAARNAIDIADRLFAS